jgi:hypothetical protein
MSPGNRVTSVLCALSVALALGASAGASGEANKSVRHAAGSFEVKMQPLSAEDKSSEGGIAKMSLEKQFHGDLEATSHGAMLATGSAAGNGAYVALEIVTGTLNGRAGSFVLQHTGIATQGGPQRLDIRVVPNSGTGQLSTLTGTMNIVIAAGKHSYDFAYSLAD